MSKPVTGLETNIQDILAKVNTKNKINHSNDWDEDDASHSVHHDVHSVNDDDNNDDDGNKKKVLSKSEHKQRTLKTIIIIGFICVTLFYIIVLLLYNPNNQKRLPLKSTDTNHELPAGEGKLNKPLLGNYNSKEQLNPNDPISKIGFDFSPITENDISRTAILPNKVHVNKTSISSGNSLEFQNLWNNGSNTQDAIQKITENKKNHQSAHDYLPRWRRFAVNYKPTENLPIFSVILEYDPKTLNIDDLPQSDGYNVVISGYLENSQSLLEQLAKKNYEVLLYLPMEEGVKSFSLKAITKDSTFDDIRDSIAFHTSQLGGNGFVGFMSKGGKDVKNILPKMNFMMSLLAKTEYLYIDNSYDSQKSLAFAAAEGQKVPSLRTKNYIHSVPTEFPNFIKQVQVEGTGIAIIKATPENIAALQKYETTLKDAHVRRIPVTGILKHQMLKTRSYF